MKKTVVAAGAVASTDRENHSGTAVASSSERPNALFRAAAGDSADRKTQ